MTILTSQTSLNFDFNKMIKYNYSMLDNIINFDIPIEGAKKTIQIKIEIENIFSFKVKKMFVSRQKIVKKKYSQLSELKSVMKG